MPARDKDESRYEERVREALRAFCDEAGGQIAAAKRLGYSQGMVSRILRGVNHPGTPFLVALARETGQSLDSLLGLAPPAQQPADEMADIMKQLRAEQQQILEELRRATKQQAAPPPRPHTTTRLRKP